AVSSVGRNGADKPGRALVVGLAEFAGLQLVGRVLALALTLPCALALALALALPLLLAALGRGLFGLEQKSASDQGGRASHQPLQGCAARPGCGNGTGHGVKCR